MERNEHPMTYRCRLLIVTAAIVLLLPSSAKRADEGSKPSMGEEASPGVRAEGINVVWFVIDALRADHLGCYGYSKSTSPFLDRFASTSILFKNAIAQESYTQASVPSYFTSTYPSTHGVLYDNPKIDVLDSKFVTIAEILSTEGYSTAAFVFNPHLKSKYGFGKGFDLYDDNAEGWSKGVPFFEKFETARKILEKTEKYLKESTQRPVFIYLHYRDVHGPYAPPPPYHKVFLPPGHAPKVDVLYPGGSGGSRIDPKKNLDLYLSQYDGEIRYTDAYIEETMAMLAGHGIVYENSMFIITADHGEEFRDRHPGDPGGWRHGRTLYREQVHVPLIMSIPGLKAERGAFDSYVELVDIAPTILDVLDIDYARFNQFRGRSLLPMIRSGSEEGRQVYFGGNHGRGAIVEDGWKYYRQDKRNKTKRRRVFKQPKKNQKYNYVQELYHVDEDPHETRNLVEEHPELARELARKLREKEDQLRAGEVSPAVEVDEELQKQLEALGYL